MVRDRVCACGEFTSTSHSSYTWTHTHNWNEPMKRFIYFQSSFDWIMDFCCCCSFQFSILRATLCLCDYSRSTKVRFYFDILVHCLLTVIDNKTHDHYHNEEKSIGSINMSIKYYFVMNVRVLSIQPNAYTTSFSIRLLGCFVCGQNKLHNCAYEYEAWLPFSDWKRISKNYFIFLWQEVLKWTSFGAYDFIIPKRPFRCVPVCNRQNAFVVFCVHTERWCWVESRHRADCYTNDTRWS